LSSLAQKPRFSDALWTKNWKLEVKTGGMTIFTPVPPQYLGRTNNLNVPVQKPGLASLFSVRKSFSPHFETGYQFGYLNVQGPAMDAQQAPANVRTQVYSHTFQVQYNLIRNDAEKPLFNYFVYYTVGGLSLRNDRVSAPEGVPEPARSKLIGSVAMVSGLGAGMNVQLNKHFSLSGSGDINRTVDAVAEVFKIYKIPTSSSHTVNNFMEITIGLTYWLNTNTKNKSNAFRSRSKTQRHIKQSKTEHKKGKSSNSTILPWYDSKRGK
jgi:hypothetical protein